MRKIFTGKTGGLYLTVTGAMLFFPRPSLNRLGKIYLRSEPPPQAGSHVDAISCCPVGAGFGLFTHDTRAGERKARGGTRGRGEGDILRNFLSPSHERTEVRGTPRPTIPRSFILPVRRGEEF